MFLVAQERGAHFRQSIDGYWYDGTPWDIIMATYDDMFQWLQCEDFQDYMNKLIDEGPSIFARATY